MHILHPEDISAYLKEADKRGVLAMFFLELTTGLRKGELVALLWSDLDETLMTLNVCKQAVRVKGGGVKVTRPKTETSIRRISLSQETVDILRKELAKHPDIEYMFPSPVTLGMYYPDSVTDIHNKVLKSAGLPHIRLHDFRHPSPPERRERENRVQHPRPLRRWVHAKNLHPRHNENARKAAATMGKLIGANI